MPNNKRNQGSKRNQQQVPHGHRYDLNGWTYVSIRGEPFERGKAYGQLIAADMVRVTETLRFLVYHDFGVPWSFFVKAARKYFCDKISSLFPEFYEEMRGFAEGANMSVEEVVAWNNYFTLTESWWGHMPEEEAMEVYGSSSSSASSSSFSSSSSKEGGGSQERCTAFIAVGKEWTEDGEIVCGHNNFSNFVDGQFAKFVVDIRPTQGHRMLMLGFPGWIWSGTDFFVTSAGILGTETTIGGFHAYENKVPISCRIRQAMQYGSSLDDYERALLAENSGDYANSWLLGDTRRNEIMRIELGLRFHNTERTRSGYFIGFNAPYDPRIRNLECANTGMDDVRRHQGARRVRLEDLMDKWKGRLNVRVAQQILADHYDVYLRKENPCSRTCCSHYELDGREYMSDPSRPKPFQPRGALDGNVVDSALARRMSFWLRWGNSCGTPFDAAAFCRRNRVWAYLLPYLEDRPRQPWTLFEAERGAASMTTRRRRRRRSDRLKQRRVLTQRRPSVGKRRKDF